MPEGDIVQAKYGIFIVIFVAVLIVFVGALTPYMEGTSQFMQRYIFFGNEDIVSQIEVVSPDMSGVNMGGLITAFMIWLIIFSGFGDVMSQFSAFSRGISWVIAFAVAIVAACVSVNSSE